MRPVLRRGSSVIAGSGWYAEQDLPAGALALVVAPGGEPPVNHSCDPNLGWSADGLVTMRDVPAGVELTTDYALAIAEPDYLLRCHCETYRCRQLIGGDDWRIEQLQRRYAGWFAPAVAALVGAAS